MRDQPEAETWQYTKLIRDKYPCPQRDSSPQSQEASDLRPTPLTARPLGYAALFSIYKIFLMFYMGHFLLFEFSPHMEKLYPFRKARPSRSRIIRDPVYYHLPVCSQIPQTTFLKLLLRTSKISCLFQTSNEIIEINV